jgi:hypothetical protein
MNESKQEIDEERALEAELEEEDHRLAGYVSVGIKGTLVTLSLVTLPILLGVGKDLWPAWLLAHQGQLVGLLLLALLFLTIASPIMVEVTKSPRLLPPLRRHPPDNAADDD